MTETLTPTLDLIATPKKKMTLLILGAGMMGCDVRKTAVSKGWVETQQRGKVLCYSEPRGRKIFGLIPLLQQGAIVLNGFEESRPVFESHARSVDGSSSFLLDGVGGRFIDYDREGADALISYLQKHLVLHTLGEQHTLTLLEEFGGMSSQRDVADPDFKRKLLDGLGPAVSLEPPTPTQPTRKTLFSAPMLQKLKDARFSKVATPIFRLFLPDSAMTWLVCSMEDDGDTLWVVGDMGFGCVEYGTASLEELETLQSGRFKMSVERDKYWDGTTKTMREILSMETIATGV